MQVIKIKNDSGSIVIWVGKEFTIGEEYTVPTDGNITKWQNNSVLLTAIANNDALVSNGVEYFSDINQSINWLKGNIIIEVDLVKKSPITGRPEFIAVEAEGNGEALCTHNFMDKCTWYEESVRIIAESPVLDTGKIYDLAKDGIIDSSHGRITFEDENNAAQLFYAYDAGVELVQDTDYTVDFELGKVTVDASYTLTGALTVDYSYANGSTYTMKPATGKTLSIKDAEIQFSSDLSMEPIAFEIWAYDPNDLPNKTMVYSRKYKNIRDIINVARQGKGQIEACDVLTLPTYVFPFSYDRKIALEASKGMELRVRIINNIEMGGQYGTMTFYVIEEDE